MRALERDGEGLFLVSYEVDDLEEAAARARAAGAATTAAAAREGLDGWRVIDLEPAGMHGAPVQLCEEVPR
jgi:methylmalonyl-CoA/ethylmalonyl-CoA epimerase